MRFVIGFCLLCTLFPVLAFSQEAKVIPLDRKEAAEAKQLYQNLQSAQKEWDAFQNAIRETYLIVSEAPVDSIVCDNGKGGRLENCTSASPFTPKHESIREGWQNGFTFDSDFLYIVPKTQTGNSNSQICIPYGYSYYTPASGVFNNTPAKAN
jgi:hypothetical protein